MSLYCPDTGKRSCLCFCAKHRRYWSHHDELRAEVERGEHRGDDE